MADMSFMLEKFSMKKFKYIPITQAILAIWCLFQTACGNPVVTVDPAIAPYVQRFEQQIGVKANGISINFADLTGDTSGICYYNLSPRQIYLSRFYWDHDNDMGKEQTVYHELGHCLFNFQHNADTVHTFDGYDIPGSIMNPLAFGNYWFYPLYHALYIEAYKHNTIINL